MSKIAIIILARKQSIRIPNKNIILLKGKPLIKYTLDFAEKLNYPIWVFTDMEEVKNICISYKDINIRSKKYESINGIHQTAKELIDYNKEIDADFIILLQITSPFRNVEKAKNWINGFCESDYDCGFAGYCEAGYFYKSGCDGQIRAINHDPKERTYNQGNYTRLIKETGSFYIFKKEQLQKNHILNGKIIYFEDDYNIDINTYEDLRKAEYEN